MSADPAITVESLRKSFANETVLKDISLTVDDGEFCVIVGPSGSGKSTLLECISGLLEYDAGSATVHGEDIETTPVEQRDIGYVFQEFEETLFPHMTVAENIEFGLRQQEHAYDSSEIDRRIDEMLELLAISQTRENLPTELSGGQQQRVELARQLIRECDVMLLDDPLADLDYKLQKRMELEMRRIHGDMESTFLYVTHNQDQALKLADKLIVMNHGHIEQIGTPSEVYQNPASAFVARFVGDSNAFIGTASTQDGELVFESELGPISATAQTGNPANVSKSIAVVRPNDVAFGGDADTRENVFEAELAGWTYMGEETEVSFRLAEEMTELRAVEPGKPSVTADDIGKTMQVGWNASDTLCFETLSVTETVTISDLAQV